MRMARARARHEAENTAAIVVAVHNAHVADEADALTLRDLCPWIPKPEEDETDCPTLGEVAEMLKRQWPEERGAGAKPGA